MPVPLFAFEGLILLAILLCGLAAFFHENNFGGIFFFIASALLLISGLAAFSGITTDKVTGYNEDMSINYEALTAVQYEPYWVFCTFLSLVGVVGILASTAFMGKSLMDKRNEKNSEWES
jgi:hypothetical protein